MDAELLEIHLKFYLFSSINLDMTSKTVFHFKVD